MKKIINFINELSKSQKITCLILISVLVLVVSIGIPTLARYKNRGTLPTVSVWDGSVGTSYRSGNGIEGDPYIISTGAELAYFYTQLSQTDYDNTYFTLSSDIVLNDGVFNYDATNKIQYILDEQTYYVDDYTNKYYDNVELTGTEIGTVNIFNSLSGFKGTFDGGSFRIYGLYITNETSEELALFTNLQGEIKDLYVENSIIYGGTLTAGIASTTTNASISNVQFDGDVVGKNAVSSKNITSIPTAPVVSIQNYETVNYINLTNTIPFMGSEIISTSITGNYVVDGLNGGTASIVINGQTVTDGTFNIDLGSSILDSIPVLTYTSEYEGVTLTFTNLSYNIVYNYAVAGGIVASSNNTVIKNTINKASVYGYSTSGGLVGVTTNLLSIDQSYNTGNINSAYISGGLIGTIEKSSDNITISKSYNTGAMTALNIGGLVGIITNNSGVVSISNTFNTSSTNYTIGTVSNTTVNVDNSYFVNGVSSVKEGLINGSFVSTTLSSLKTKNIMIDTLFYNEFIDFDDIETNNQNVWVYEDDSLPILFIDDISNPIASINVSVYSWNNLSYELSPVKLNTNITFAIESADELNPIKEKYYYISNSTVALTKAEISAINSWNSYSSVEQILTEGFYTIYVKVVDYDDNITYLNTDLLFLDLPGVSASVELDDSAWGDLRSSLDNIYLDRDKYVTVSASDDISGISSIKYYITDDILETTELDSLNESSWVTYSEGILIENIGKNIVYAKIVDSFDYVTYINTDYLILDGYTQTSLTLGRNATSYLNADAYITDKSTITLNTVYASTSASNLVDYTHNLISNILLPLNSKITLIDNITKKIYEYKITTASDIYNYNNSCDIEDLDCIKTATYPLVLFKEIGTSAVNNFFPESTYYDNGTVSEDFTIILDLANTNIELNYDNVVLSLELHDPTSLNVRPTLYSSLKKFNIYSNVDEENTGAILNLTTDYLGDPIQFNSDSVSNINITSGINYKYINDFKITDTSYEDKTIGLAIKLVDGSGNTVDKDYLKNVMFKIGDDIYYPGDDNIVRINLKSGISDVTSSLKITTFDNNSNLEDGIYYFKISNYVSDDGIYYDELGPTELSVPVNVSNVNTSIEYGFNAIMNDDDRIISKESSSVNVAFNISQSGYLNSPNIKVSLYKKDQLTAYSQSYSIVDLASYVSDVMSISAPNIYYVSTNPTEENNIFELNLITANFENTGYKFVFDLYDDTKKIGTIEKYFIVK